MSHRSSKSSLRESGSRRLPRSCPLYPTHPPARCLPAIVPCSAEARKLMRSRRVREERSGEGAVGRRSADEGGGGGSGSGRVGSGRGGLAGRFGDRKEEGDRRRAEVDETIRARIVGQTRNYEGKEKFVELLLFLSFVMFIARREPLVSSSSSLVVVSAEARY
ncbi:unnamed protein product [Calypogeia fissa]